MVSLFFQFSFLSFSTLVRPFLYLPYFVSHSSFCFSFILSLLFVSYFHSYLSSILFLSPFHSNSVLFFLLPSSVPFPVFTRSSCFLLKSLTQTFFTLQLPVISSNLFHFPPRFTFSYIPSFLSLPSLALLSRLRSSNRTIVPVNQACTKKINNKTLLTGGCRGCTALPGYKLTWKRAKKI